MCQDFLRPSQEQFPLLSKTQERANVSSCLPLGLPCGSRGRGRMSVTHCSWGRTEGKERSGTGAKSRRAKGNSPFPAPHPPTKSSQALPVEAELGQLESGRIISHTRTRTPGRWDAPQLHLFQRMTELDWTVQTQKIKGYFPPFGLKKKKSSFSSFLTLPPSLRDWFYLKNCILPRHSKLLSAWSKLVG